MLIDTEAIQYRVGFWRRCLRLIELTCLIIVCGLMSGYGGITAVMMPNGATYYYFSNKEEFSWYNAVKEANKLKIGR